MIRSQNAMTKNKSACVAPDEDAGTLDRSFKYAVIAYAVVEFFAIALLLYYKFAR